MKILIILNEKPLANEKTYNALRIAAQFQKDSTENQVKIYLLADAVFCALANVQESNAVLNVEQAIKGIIKNGGTIKMCTSCGDARGLREKKLIDGVEWTNLKTLTDWITESDKVINY